MGFDGRFPAANRRLRFSSTCSRLSPQCAPRFNDSHAPWLTPPVRVELQAATPAGNGDGGLKHRDDAVTTQKSNSFGLFGSATWHITDRLNFTGGLRYAYDKKDYAQTEYASNNFTPAPGTTSTTSAPS